MVRRKLTPEQRAANTQKQRDHVALIKHVCRLVGKPYMEVQTIWSVLDDGLRIGVAAADNGAIAEVKRLIEVRYPPMEYESALKIMAWAVQKVRDPDMCRKAFEQAILLLEEES